MTRIPYIRHFHHREVERLRHSSIANAWINAQAERLSKTRAEIEELLRTHTAQEISNMEPEPVEPVDPDPEQ